MSSADVPPPPTPAEQPPPAQEAVAAKKKKKNKKKKAAKPAGNEIESSYFKWLKDSKVVINNLSIFNFPDTGRGVRVDKNIAAGERVLTVPHSTLITARVVRASQSLKPVFHAFPRAEDDDVLAVFLMYERQVAEKNGQSNWSNHIKMQPPTYSNLLYFSKDDLTYLKGSNLEPISTQLFQQVEDDYKTWFPKLLAKFSSLFEPGFFTIEAYKWALSTIWSRAFDLLIKGKKERALVPFADMFNHSFDAQVDHHFEDSSNSLVFTATKPISAQGQAFICYDPAIPNIRLLRLYGFCVPFNPNDAVDLYAPLSPSIPLYEPKRRLLAKLSLELPNYPISLKNGISPSLLNYLRIRRIEDESDIELAKKKVTSATSTEIISVANETVVLVDLQQAINSMLQQYGSTAEHDILFLQTPIANPNVFNAVTLRLAEKKILKTALVEIEQKRADLLNKL